MKVLLVSPNIETLPDPVFPLGLAYISAELEKNGIQHKILDLCFADDFKNAIETTINDFNPDIVGLSLRNIDNVSYPNYISYLPFFRKVIQNVRKQSEAHIVLGGSGFSLIPDLVMTYLDADYGVIGEGEVSFVRLVRYLQGKEDLSSVLRAGIMDHHQGIIERLDDQQMPERARFDNGAYLKWGGMGNIQTKRGCPFQCIYCTYPIIEGKHVRLRDPGLVCDEIEIMLEQGIDNIFIVDDTFNHPVHHAMAICNEITSRGLSFQWSCYANPKYITQSLLDSMLSAGCTSLEFGSDAANDIILRNLGKNFKVSDLEKASKICREFDMAFCHSLLLGGPGETMETVFETLEAIKDMSPTAVICMVGTRVFPGTRLAAICVEEGLVGPKTDFLKPIFYLSPAIENEILPFLEKFSRQNPNWIFPGLNINMNKDLQRKLRRFGIKGPLWEYMKAGKRFREK
jgi:radical SAM superfamily enzyme YgiQ (UPF0313 family)